MENAWKTETKFWDNPAPNAHPVRSKRVHCRKTLELVAKNQKPSSGHGTVLEGWLNGPCKIHSTADTIPTHSLRACWILRQVAKSGEDHLIPAATELTVFETFVSNNRRK